MKLKSNQASANAFTLIELLVVIAIIGLLVSIVLVGVSRTRSNARDVKRKADLLQINTALQAYYIDNGTMPTNYTPCCYYADNQPNFLSQLVPNYMAKVPHDPLDIPNTYTYYYYDYGVDPCGGTFVIAPMENLNNQTSNMPALAACNTSWNAPHNGHCLTGNTAYCVWQRE
ncbi:MAG: gspG [Candidatus Doudnabacteria bacterium]|nr:gspG [Candidatus Doudnabacteria bacterium]